VSPESPELASAWELASPWGANANATAVLPPVSPEFPESPVSPDVAVLVLLAFPPLPELPLSPDLEVASSSELAVAAPLLPD
jgi:hypothetical protein